MTNIIGRTQEIKFLYEKLLSKKSELGIVYGRRRVGKSSLLKHLQLKKNYYFEGVKNYPLKKQVAHFLKQFAEQEKLPPLKGDTWEQAFDILTPYISKGQVYMVFDEISWMANDKTDLIALFKYYWDNKWKQNNQLKLILCGSIAQFMVNHIIHSETLHNRKTFELKLKALPSHEAGLFLRKKTSNYEKLLYLMTIGGIPKYLEQIENKYTFDDNLRRIFFNQNGFFFNEFETIFKEQFKTSKNYEKIITCLAQAKKTQAQLTQELKLDGGGFSLYLQNLISADFIKRLPSLSFDGKMKEKTIKYQTQDEFIKFYKIFIEPNKSLIESNLGDSLPDRLQRQLAAFFGLAFESFCHKNIETILEHLHIKPSEILNFGSNFSQEKRKQNTQEIQQGVQIDLMIILKKKRIVLCECKFTEKKVGIEVIDEVKKKIERLKIPKNYSISPVLISASGANQAVTDEDFFDHIVTADILF